MFNKEVVVRCESGLHNKQATYFVQKANEFESSIWLESENRKMNAKSLYSTLSGITSIISEISQFRWFVSMGKPPIYDKKSGVVTAPDQQMVGMPLGSTGWEAAQWLSVNIRRLTAPFVILPRENGLWIA